MKLIRAYLACKGGVLPCSQKYTPYRVHFCPTLPTPNLNHSNQLQAHRCNVTPPNVASPNNVSPKNVAPKCGVTGKCGVTKQCVAKECGAKMWRHRKMWRHQTMWRQTMWRQNVASQENVASPSNVAPNNVAPGKCGVTKQCGSAKQCSAKMWRHRKMRRHQTMWRQTMWRHMSSKCVFIMCLQRQVEKCVLFCQHRVYIYIYSRYSNWMGIPWILFRYQKTILKDQRRWFPLSLWSRATSGESWACCLNDIFCTCFVCVLEKHMSS